MEDQSRPISRAKRREMIRRIDRTLLDIYPRHTKLVKWWRGLDKKTQEDLREDKNPPKDYVTLVELDKAVVSLIRDRRKLQGNSKNPNGIEHTIRRHK